MILLQFANARSRAAARECRRSAGFFGVWAARSTGLALVVLAFTPALAFSPVFFGTERCGKTVAVYRSGGKRDRRITRLEFSRSRFSKRVRVMARSTVEAFTRSLPTPIVTPLVPVSS